MVIKNRTDRWPMNTIQGVTVRSTAAKSDSIKPYCRLPSRNSSSVQYTNDEYNSQSKSGCLTCGHHQVVHAAVIIGVVVVLGVGMASGWGCILRGWGGHGEARTVRHTCTQGGSECMHFIDCTADKPHSPPVKTETNNQS